MTHHSGDEGHAERGVHWMPDPEGAGRVFRVLKDADALDRVRLGKYDLDVLQLRFPESVHRVGRAWQLLEASKGWQF